MSCVCLLFCALVGDVMHSLQKKKKIHLLEDVLQLSKGGDAYHWICVKLMKCVVGFTIWQRRCFKELLSEFATDSDETFLVLTVENNYQRWMDEARYRTGTTLGRAKSDSDDDASSHDNDKENEVTSMPSEDCETNVWKDKLAPAKYTNSGASALNGKGSNRRCSGWSKEGYKRFNQLYAQIKEDRKRRANFELELKEQCQVEHNVDDDGNNSDSDDEEIIPANDWVGAMQPEAADVDKED
jgi:hypothetical protein